MVNGLHIFLPLSLKKMKKKEEESLWWRYKGSYLWHRVQIAGGNKEALKRHGHEQQHGLGGVVPERHGQREARSWRGAVAQLRLVESIARVPH